MRVCVDRGGRRGGGGGGGGGEMTGGEEVGKRIGQLRVHAMIHF